MAELPTGTVTFLFTDIEGSTRLWEQHPEAMREALARHDALLRQAIEDRGGCVFKTVGDQFCAVFASAVDALAAALSAQRRLQQEHWEATGALRVRMALHTGATEARERDYFGPALNRVARLLAVGHGDQILLSAAAQELTRAALPVGARLRDLGSHRLKDLQQPEHLFQLLYPSLPGNFPPLRSLEAFAHNLPAQLTSFIGRVEAMAEVRQLLATTRLLTLTGSGGCGKTRLALQVAADLLEAYANGVWLVELAALADPTLVPETVASALGVREQPGRPLTETLVDYLKPKALLLILDNCEHLLTASAQLADALLRSCPSLRLLASSREGLGIGGEQTYRVPSLALPPIVESGKLRVESSGKGSGQPASDLSTLNSQLSTLMTCEAVQLFADRARLSQATFVVTPANAPAVAQVCQRLDGIPLAIELAAARVRALPVEQIHARLDDMFRLLTGGSRTALPRQQTLRALIDWSFDLLSAGEQTLLRRLSVFAGGWTLEAAEAVCGGAVGCQPSAVSGGSSVLTDSRQPRADSLLDVLDLLTSLVDKSLVTYDEQGGEGRYRLLETVRQYARDRLLEAREAAAVRGRHRDWFLALAERAEPELWGAEPLVWLDRLEGEHDNLRSALEWCQAEEGGAGAALRLAGALGRLWQVRGYLREGRRRLAVVLSREGAEAPTAGRANVLNVAARLAFFQNDYAAARALHEESLAIWQELGDNWGIANSFYGLGTVAQEQGDSVLARSLYERSLALFSEMGDKQGIANALRGLANVTPDVDGSGGARSIYEQCLAICRELGDIGGIASNLGNLGQLALRRGDYGAARALWEESLVLSRGLQHKRSMAWSLGNLGNVLQHQSDYGAARALYEEALVINRELGNRWWEAILLTKLAQLAFSQCDHRAARALYEESLVVRRDLVE